MFSGVSKSFEQDCDIDNSILKYLRFIWNIAEVEFVLWAQYYF